MPAAGGGQVQGVVVVRRAAVEDECGIGDGGRDSQDGAGSTRSGRRCGRNAPVYAAQAYVESAGDYPPAVTDLALVLDCGAANNNYTLDLTAGSGGTAIADPPGGSYAAGTNVTLTATPDAGQVFVGWDIAIGGQAAPPTWAQPAQPTLTANATAKAHFAPRPTFGDVPAGDPAFEPVAQLAARGIINGCDKDAVPPLFCPNARPCATRWPR